MRLSDLDDASANSKEGSEREQGDVFHRQPEFFYCTFASEQVLRFASEVFLRAALANHEEGAEDGGEVELAATQPG